MSKNRFIKIISLLLAAVTIFSVSASAYAASAADENSALNFDDISDDTVVGTMSICTQQVGLGHAWIYIESCFNGEMPVGLYTLAPYEGVSVGTFGLTRSDGAGVYYNIETYCAERYGLKNQSSLCMEITKAQLLVINEKIISWNHWDPFFNCTYFAKRVWNSVSSENIVSAVFPVFTKWQILAKGGTQTVEMKSVEAENCFKQKGTGGDAYLVPVSEGSLDSKLL